jgi:Plant transposon protein
MEISTQANAYWLGDGIYPKYACFVKSFPHPTTPMQKLFLASAQEAKRKDIEQAFGIKQQGSIY